MTPQPVTNLSGYSLRKNYGVESGRSISKQSGGFTKTFIWTYFDIAVDIITDGKLTEIQTLVNMEHRLRNCSLGIPEH